MYREKSHMTHKERQLAAIRHVTPDRLPVDCICIENLDAVAAHLGMGADEAMDRLGIDGRIMGPGYTGPTLKGPNGEECTDFGVVHTGDYGTAHSYPLSFDTTLADIGKYPWPQVKDYDVAGLRQRALPVSQKYAVRGPYWMPLFCQVCDLFGMETAMEKMLADETVFDAALERIAEVVTGVCVRMMDECQGALDILCLGDDFATQRGMMISLESWRKHLKPHYTRLFAEAQKRGYPVWFHSCGDVTAVLPDLIEIGVDVWETVQLHTLPISAIELKREYGKDLCFFGAINTQRLPFATPVEVREETLRCIEALGKGGGYICGPDHHIKPQVSVESTLALFDTATSFRLAGYTG